MKLILALSLVGLALLTACGSPTSAAPQHASDDLSDQLMVKDRDTISIPISLFILVDDLDDPPK